VSRSGYFRERLRAARDLLRRRLWRLEAARRAAAEAAPRSEAESEFLASLAVLATLEAARLLDDARKTLDGLAALDDAAAAEAFRTLAAALLRRHGGRV